MSTPGRPKGEEQRSAQHEVPSMHTPGRPKGEEQRSAQHEVPSMHTPGRPKDEEQRSAQREGTPVSAMNLHAIRAIYRFEMDRTWRTLMQSIVSPVISTSLYFVVFGAAIGSRIPEVGGISYGAFIVPGLVMLSLLTQSISNASFGIYFPKFSGTIYEVLSAPVSYVEITLAYVGAAATKSILLGLIILATAALFVPLRIQHPVWMVLFLVLTAVTFSLVGFIIGIWADGFEKLQVVPLLIVTPLTFLGGSFYTVDMLPGIWQKVALFNPVVYLVSGFRWSFYGVGDVSVGLSLGMALGFLAVSLAIVAWIFKTGYRLKA
jgi:ABC-2 type transport system permease protein